jgi:[protein-PII] uridylyltransferase
VSVASAWAATARAAIVRCNAAQYRAFLAGTDIGVLLGERSRCLDGLLVAHWQATMAPIAGDGAALVAVGGYGRGELFPASDIDLLILLSDAAAASEPARQAIERFVVDVYDLGLDVGHSVRTLGQCVEEARRDVGVATSLMEARPLVDPAARCPAMLEATSAARLWKAAHFHHAKVDEQRRRHRQFDHIDYKLEPNVKGGPGGLRDIQTVVWVAQRHYGTGALSHLRRLGFVTHDEELLLDKARRFLSRVRFGLHFVAGTDAGGDAAPVPRREDRLLFEHQRALTEALGYGPGDQVARVEQFMSDYYRHVLEVEAINELLLQHFAELILPPDRDRVVPLNERFRIRNGHLEVVAPDVFRRHPPALLEVFVLIAHRPDIDGVRATTMRLVRENAGLVDEDFRRDPHNAALFMDLLRSPHKLYSQLTRMRRYGVLGRYLPEFGQVIGRMQHDLFHIYTVDAHTLQVVRNMRHFVLRLSEARFPVACECVRRLPRVELLYIAGLYHDIGKGRGGDHSEHGARDAGAFCDRHGITGAERELVCWLVASHLLMSATAQRKDISDPDVIAEFAREVRTPERLDYLYALTVADITATNPTLWNGFRASLLRQLFSETRQALQRGVEHIPDRETRIAAGKRAARAQLRRGGVADADVDRVWRDLDAEYFLRNEPDDIVWQTLAIQGHDPDTGPLVTVRDLGRAAGEFEGATEVFVFTRDQPNLFAACAAALAQLNLSVQDARIHTSASGLCFNTFVVLDERRLPIGDDRTRIDRIQATLHRELTDPAAFPALVARPVARRSRHFGRPTRVALEQVRGANYSVLRLETSDRPGLLARIGLVFLELGLTVRGARITTLGERVEDIFEISAGDAPLVDAGHIATLIRTLRERLDEGIR